MINEKLPDEVTVKMIQLGIAAIALHACIQKGYPDPVRLSIDYAKKLLKELGLE